MKKILIVLLSLLVLCGCEYTVPLSPKADMPIKNELIGLWKFEPVEEDDKEFTMLVLKFTPNEYIIRYGDGEEIIYLRAYHVRLKGFTSLIQVECLGFQNSPVEATENSVYNLIKYNLEGNKLTIEILNSDVVDKNCKTSREFKSRILVNINHKELFRYPGVFRKIK